MCGRGLNKKEGKDGHVVAVMRNRTIVGYVPRNIYISTLFSYFLSRSCNKAVVEVTGEKLNRGSGYRGWRHPAFIAHIYIYGPDAYFERFKKIIKDMGN